MTEDAIQPGPNEFSADEDNAAATRTQLSVDHDRDRLRTEDQRDAAYKEITGEDRPGSEARRKLIGSFR
jgi:hypothetical protein